MSPNVLIKSKRRWKDPLCASPILSGSLDTKIRLFLSRRERFRVWKNLDFAKTFKDKLSAVVSWLLCKSLRFKRNCYLFEFSLQAGLERKKEQLVQRSVFDWESLIKENNKNVSYKGRSFLRPHCECSFRIRSWLFCNFIGAFALAKHRR